MIQHSEAREIMNALDAEIARSVHLTEEDRQMLVGAVCLGSAVLLEGVPGTGKTTIAKTTATAIGGKFGRVQGAPDLLPGDITGVNVWNPADGSWDFKSGPIFSNVLLTDEINRMSPKAQAALLQSMQEGEVTINNDTHELPSPFVVLATQNPNELGQGTYPLTKANLDRFAISINLPMLGIPEMLAVEELSHTPEAVLEPKDIVIATEGIVSNQAASPEVKRRAADIIDKLRQLDVINIDESVLGGARPLQQIIRHAKALAMHEGQETVKRDHIDKVAPYVLSHRTQLSYTADMSKTPVAEVINTAVKSA